jgi:hypothetical protein
MSFATVLRVFAVALVVSVLTGCGNAPIYNVTNHSMPQTAQNLTQQEIDAIVIKEATERGWKLEPLGPGHMKGVLDIRSHRAVVDIRADKSSLNIKYLESTNLNERNGIIDRNYNRWVVNLERDIPPAIAAAGATKVISR